MGIVNAVITEPIAIADIRAAISVSSNDLYTLSVSDKVNKFSKKKPYRGTSPTTPTYNASVGSDGAPGGTNPRWGLLVPTNTKEQLGTSSDARFLKPLAWRASGRGGTATNIQNYTYLRLRNNTDFARMVDWVGYEIAAPDPWMAGVSGAIPQSNGTSLNVDTFDAAEVSFYLGRPSNASLGFKDFFVANDYYFVAELYKNDQSITGDNDTPEAIIVSTTKVADMAFGINIPVKVSKIKSLLGFSGDGQHSLVAVTGISRITSLNPATYEATDSTGKKLGYAVFNTDPLRNSIIAGSGSLPPWTSSLRTFICDIKMQSYSKVEFVFLQYSLPVNGSAWNNMPTGVVTYHSDGIRFKMQARNVGSSAFVFNDSGNRNRLQLQARGNYDTTAPDYQSKCLSPGESKWRDVRVSNTANFTSTPAITLAAGATNSALYFHIDGVMPAGRTSGFTLRISTDGGNTWVITGSMAAVFEVPK